MSVLAAKLVNEFVEAADERRLTKTVARYGRVDPLPNRRRALRRRQRPMPLLELLKYRGRKGDDLLGNPSCASPDLVFLAHDVLRDRMAGVAVRLA